MLQIDHSHDTAEDTNRGARSEAGKRVITNVILERNDGGGSLKEKNENRDRHNRQARSYKSGSSPNRSLAVQEVLNSSTFTQQHMLNIYYQSMQIIIWKLRSKKIN